MTLSLSLYIHRVVAETSTGCLLGGSANGKKGKTPFWSLSLLNSPAPYSAGEPPYKTGRAAADQMLKAVKEGACVDEHLQDQVSAISLEYSVFTCFPPSSAADNLHGSSQGSLGHSYRSHLSTHQDCHAHCQDPHNSEITLIVYMDCKFVCHITCRQSSMLGSWRVMLT